MNPIEVAVVMVNYRSAPLTLRSLAALETEREALDTDGGIALAAIVVENASGDEEALRSGIRDRFSHFARLVVSPVNGGFGAGNNLGVRAAREGGRRPRYVHFLNPDTEVRAGAVRELVRFMEAHPRAGTAGSSFEHADGTPWQIAFRFPSALGELEGSMNVGLVTRLLQRSQIAQQFGDQAARVDWVSGASFMMRAETLEELGGFDEGYFLYFEETDLALRARDAGWECWYVPESRVMHLRGQSTGVTALDAGDRRIPSYWFESRRRYFLKNHGLRYALGADLAFLLGNLAGSMRRRLKGEPVPRSLLRDSLRESALWPRNRIARPAPVSASSLSAAVRG
jgi:N-acetylglucosaminyl-diphospho-decaprenol L-rhamnosyltransferase